MKRCEICEGMFVKIHRHHIISKSCGGSNSKNNIARLCPNCHTMVHLGEYIIEGRFNSTKGDVLIYREKDQQSITGLVDPDVYITS